MTTFLLFSSDSLELFSKGRSFFIEFSWGWGLTLSFEETYKLYLE